MAFSEGFLVAHNAPEDFFNSSASLGLTENGNAVVYENVSAASTVNDSLDGDRGSEQAESFFRTYYSMPRFWTETVLAISAASGNSLVLLAVRKAHARRSVYNTLFINLAIANTLSCVLSWLCNNALVFFSGHFTTMLQSGVQMCTIFVYLSAAVFVSNAFGLVSTFTMLGFTTVQYYAVCRPLHHLSIIRRHRVKLCIILSWGVCFLAGCVPWGVLIAVSTHMPCDNDHLDLIMLAIAIASNVCIALISLIYLCIVVLCIRIYVEIQNVHKASGRYRQDRNFKGERKAFFTIIILLATLTIFYIPFNIIYVVSSNSGGTFQTDGDALIYFMTLMPYLKYLSDPINYGLRMREVREGWSVLISSCGCVKKPKLSVTTSRSTSFTLTRMSSMNVSAAHTSRL